MAIANWLWDVREVLQAEQGAESVPLEAVLLNCLDIPYSVSVQTRCVNRMMSLTGLGEK